jgi:hypothetical protein
MPKPSSSLQLMNALLIREADPGRKISVLRQEHPKERNEKHGAF